MTNDAVQKQYYLDIEGEQVAVSKEVYLAYMQPVWREQTAGLAGAKASRAAETLHR